jgi:hypothetical protein
MMADRVQALIGKAGETITSTRVTHGSYGTATRQSPPSVQSDTMKASVRQYRAREIAGLVQQGDREVRIAAADLSFTPQPNDQVVIGGQTYQIVSVNTRRPCNEAAIHLVQVRGGHGSCRHLGAWCVTWDGRSWHC